MFAWGIVSSSQFFLTGRTSFLVCRFLVALFTGAIIPNVIMVCILRTRSYDWILVSDLLETRAEGLAMMMEY